MPLLEKIWTISVPIKIAISFKPNPSVNLDKLLNHQPFHGSNYTKKRLTIQRLSKLVEVLLSGNPLIFHAVIGFFRPHIQNQPNREQIQIPDGNPQFHTPQKEQRRGHFPLTSANLFFDVTSVTRFSPHSSRICGSTS